ncbi:hypothetical protein ACFQ3Z_21835 [Streptomyces nogalater]
MSVEENLAKVAEALHGIDHTAPSNSKYKYGRLMAMMAELVDLPSTAVYASHVSKPDNLEVRLGQSKMARGPIFRLQLFWTENTAPTSSMPRVNSPKNTDARSCC